MSAWWSRWVELCARREDGLAVALVRIVVAMIVGFHIVHLYASGALELVWLDAAHGGMRMIDGGVLRYFGGAVPELVYPLAVATVLASIAMVLGLTRWATWATWLGYWVLADLNGHAGGSYDELLTSELFLLGWSGAHRRLSVLRSPDSTSIAAVRWLMILQLAVMYLSSALQKVSAHWVPWGDHMALWYILQQPTWQRIPMLWLAPFAWTTRVATVVSWMFEITAPLLVLAMWFRHTRTRAGRLRSLFNRLDARLLILAVGFGMHVGIEASMEVGGFSFATLALYCACFSPEEWRRAFPKLG